MSMHMLKALISPTTMKPRLNLFKLVFSKLFDLGISFLVMSLLSIFGNVARGIFAFKDFHWVGQSKVHSGFVLKVM